MIYDFPRRRSSLRPPRLPSWGTNLLKRVWSLIRQRWRPLKRCQDEQTAAVKRFLGMCQYLSKLCRNLSETVLPLRDLTKQDAKFVWSNTHENSFNSAKELIASATVLRYYDPSSPVTLQVDASENAIGGVLLQDNRPVCFTSHTLNTT